MTTHSLQQPRRVSIFLPFLHWFWKSSYFIFPDLVDKATVVLLHMPPVCGKAKSLFYLSMGTNFFDSVSMEFVIIVVTDWCLEFLLGMKYHVSCLACILPFNPGWNRHIIVAVWQMRATPEHKAQRCFLVKTRTQVAQLGLAPRLLALRVVSSQPPSPRLISCRSPRLLSLDVVQPSFPGSSVVSQGSHSSLGLGTQLLLQLAPEETELEWVRTSLSPEGTLIWHL